MCETSAKPDRLPDRCFCVTAKATAEQPPMGKNCGFFMEGKTFIAVPKSVPKMISAHRLTAIKPQFLLLFCNFFFQKEKVPNISTKHQKER